MQFPNDEISPIILTIKFTPCFVHSKPHFLLLSPLTFIKNAEEIATLWLKEKMDESDKSEYSPIISRYVFKELNTIKLETFEIKEANEKTQSQDSLQIVDNGIIKNFIAESSQERKRWRKFQNKKYKHKCILANRAYTVSTVVRNLL